MSGDATEEPERQRIERVPGARRARLTPAPGSHDEPVADPDAEPGDGPNDERMRREVPPHY